MTQEQLAVRAQSGDLEALYQLWEDFHRLLFSLAWKFYKAHGKEGCLRGKSAKKHPERTPRGVRGNQKPDNL